MYLFAMLTPALDLFFQEWQPLLPVLHRPSFLRVYEDYIADPEAGQWHSNKEAVAQLFLIFEISALSSARVKETTTPYEAHWRKALQSTSSTASLATIQCHVLAQLYYLLKADYAQLTQHRAIAVALCHQMRLHQGHQYRTLDVLESETRKKIFWSQYVLDKFASATTGSPMLLHDHDVTTEFPADIDDENISAHGISPSLPGELTKISSAIAFFKVAKILSATLTELFPSGAIYELSLEKLRSLSDMLDQWSQNLPSHLRLQFKQDKPSTNMVSCRSPLLVSTPKDLTVSFLMLFPVTRLLLHPKSDPSPPGRQWKWQLGFLIYYRPSSCRETRNADSRLTR